MGLAQTHRSSAIIVTMPIVILAAAIIRTLAIAILRVLPTFSLTYSAEVVTAKPASAPAARTCTIALVVSLLDAINGAKQQLNLPDGSTIDLTIPAGSKSGTILRLRGKGHPGLGDGPSGDALVELTVAPHAQFSREGDDIIVELPISLDEAILGAKIEVPGASGRLRVTVPKGSSSGDVLRLRGKGAPKGDGRHGDQRVVLKVVMPNTIDDGLEAFMEEWRKEHAYNPRETSGGNQ